MSDSGGLFRPASPVDELRAMLRSLGGLSAEELGTMSNDEVRRLANDLRIRLHFVRTARETLAEHVAGGRLTEDEANSLDDDAAVKYVQEANAVDMFRNELAHRRLAKPAAITPQATGAVVPQDPMMTKGEAAVIFADMLAVIASQQAQIDELVAERDAMLANFAKRITEAISERAEKGLDYEGVHVELNVLDESSELREGARTRDRETASEETSARDTQGELKLLAQQIGALNAGRKVNLEEMNRKVERLSVSSKRATHVKWKGSAKVTIGKVSARAPERKWGDDGS